MNSASIAAAATRPIAQLNTLPAKPPTPAIDGDADDARGASAKTAPPAGTGVLIDKTA